MYGSSYGVSTIVENHGGFTGNAKWLVKLIKEINSDFVGTLPDFGNNGFCMKRERLDLSNLTKPCDQQYDKYEGVEELLPFAKGISEKRVIWIHAMRNSIIPIASGIFSSLVAISAMEYIPT